MRFGSRVCRRTRQSRLAGPHCGSERRHCRSDGRIPDQISARPHRDAGADHHFHHHARHPGGVSAALLVRDSVFQRSRFDWRFPNLARRRGLVRSRGRISGRHGVDPHNDAGAPPHPILESGCLGMFEETPSGSAAFDGALDVLAVAAHPDDVEQTCGGTLLRMAELGYRSGILDLTAGDMGTRGTPEVRIQESNAAKNVLQTTWRGNLRWPDARLENTLSARMTLAMEIRRLHPRVVILPYWEGRHPDHYRAAEIGYEACFLAGLRKLDEETEPHRPHKILYSSIYANVTPSFVVDITAQFERRMAALFCYESQYGKVAQGAELFPDQQEIRERLGAVARFYGNLIGVKYGEPFVVKEMQRVDDIVKMPVRSI